MDSFWLLFIVWFVWENDKGMVGIELLLEFLGLFMEFWDGIFVDVFSGGVIGFC